MRRIFPIESSAVVGVAFSVLSLHCSGGGASEAADASGIGDASAPDGSAASDGAAPGDETGTRPPSDGGSQLWEAGAEAAAQADAPSAAEPDGAAPEASQPPTAAGSITLDLANPLGSIGANQLGANLAAWYDITQPGVEANVASLGVHLIRWPGGSTSDQYHWETQKTCGAYVNPNSTWENFMKDVVGPGQFEVVVTANYGSNAACNGGGDPSEAAAWVANAKTNGYSAHHFTVGNEVYGSWEYDLHAKKNDATTYANAIAGSSGYYALMKAADPTAQVGVVVDGAAAWDQAVLSTAPFDYVELHDYTGQQPGSESDSYLLQQAAPGITSAIQNLKTELAAVGKADTPILLGEYNSVPFNPGKQSVSIVNGLFAGMAFGELLNGGAQMLTWFIGIGGGCSTNSNAASLYGFQMFGSYNELSDGCNNVPTGTPFPTGRAAQLLSKFAVPGNSMLRTTVGSSLVNVRAYAATQGTGYAFFLFNLDESASTTVSLDLTNAPRTSFVASTTTYGKAQYDDSQQNVWTAPVSESLGSVSSMPSVTLPPWSMTVAVLQ